VSMNPPTTAPDNSASSTALTLVPPQPVATITDAEAASLVQVDPATSNKIDAMVSGYVKSLASLDPHSQDFANKVNAIHQMGNDEIRQSASVSNRLLDKPVKAMESGPFSKGATVSKSLVDLRHTVEDLDPSQQGLMSPKHLFGLIPFGNRLRDYFARYQSAQGHLNAIIQALYHGQDELRQDNAAIEQEKVNVWDIKGKLEQYIYMAAKLDAALEAQVDQIGHRARQRVEPLLRVLVWQQPAVQRRLAERGDHVDLDARVKRGGVTRSPSPLRGSRIACGFWASSATRICRPSTTWDPCTSACRGAWDVWTWRASGSRSSRRRPAGCRWWRGIRGASPMRCATGRRAFSCRPKIRRRSRTRYAGCSPIGPLQPSWDRTGGAPSSPTSTGTASSGTCEPSSLRWSPRTSFSPSPRRDG